MRYDFDNVPNRRVLPFGNKWTLYPSDTLPMWVADMDFAAPPPILKALHKFMDHGDLGYLSPSRSLYQTIAARMADLYNWKISPEMIVTIPGVNSGYNVAARAFCTYRRGYLIQTPIYNEFHETQKKTGAPQVEARLVKTIEGNRLRYEIDFDSFQRAAKRVNMFLLCNPHNPVGAIYSRAELKRMADICLKHEVLIVSDEIHSELLLGESQFRPIASLGAGTANRTITLFSASKAFNVPGLYCAFAIIPDADLRRRYLDTVYRMGLHCGGPGLIAASVAYAGRCDSWLLALRRYLTQNRDFLVEYITKYIPEMRITNPDATYLAWLDCSSLKLESSPYEFFLKRAHVVLSDGGRFGKGSEQFVRLNFGTSRKILEQGLDRMTKALRSL
jgi:cysteine-S-conjugate beta-lyase